MGIDQQNAQHHITTTNVGTSAVQIATIPTSPLALIAIPIGVPEMIIQNIGSADMYIGPANVSPSNGTLIKGGQTPPDKKTFPCGSACNTWACTATGTATAVVDLIY